MAIRRWNTGRCGPDDRQRGLTVRMLKNAADAAAFAPAMTSGSRGTLSLRNATTGSSTPCRCLHRHRRSDPDRPNSMADRSAACGARARRHRRLGAVEDGGRVRVARPWHRGKLLAAAVRPCPELVHDHCSSAPRASSPARSTSTRPSALRSTSHGRRLRLASTRIDVFIELLLS